MYVSIVDPNELVVKDQVSAETNKDIIEGKFSNHR